MVHRYQMFQIAECDPSKQTMFWYPEDCLDFETGDVDECDYIAAWEFLRHSELKKIL